MQAAMGKAAEWVKEWMNVGIHYGIYKEKFSCSFVEQQPNNERFESNMRCLESNATQIPIYMKWNYDRSQCLCSDCDWVRWIGVKTIQNERAVVCVGIASDSIYWWDFYCLFAIDGRPVAAIQHNKIWFHNVVDERPQCIECHEGDIRASDWGKCPQRNCTRQSFSNMKCSRAWKWIVCRRVLWRMLSQY